MHFVSKYDIIIHMGFFEMKRSRKMFEQVKSLNFSSEAFPTPSLFDIFPKTQNHTCLIYGRNGAGKSTIAKAFRKLYDGTTDGINSSSLIDEAGSPLSLSEELCQSIYVFDEEYINQNIRIRDDGLKSIVMLGEQADLDDKIQGLISELKKAEAAQSQAEVDLSRFTDTESFDRPEYHYKRAQDNLKANWSSRRKEIMQLGNNAPVSKDKAHDIATAPPVMTEAEAHDEYSEKLQLLNGLRKNQCQAITAPIPHIPLTREADIISLLSKKVDKPELTDREERMVQLIAEGKSDRLIKIRTKFSDSSASECPFCYQPVTQNYKEQLLDSIKKAFNKEVEEHIEQLKKALMQPVTIDFSAYYAADKSLCDECQLLLTELNDRIAYCNTYLETKINSPFAPINLSDIRLDQTHALLVTEIQSLKEKIEEYNLNISNVSNLQEQLNRLNDAIAFYEIETDYCTYLQQKGKMKAAEENVIRAKAEVERITREIAQLEQQKKQIRIAVDIINNYLSYIFCENQRLEIQVKDEQYVILSRGRNVNPRDISVGERNIIALCYFFAKMFAGMEEKDRYKKEALVVIDDPVSSFDIDNHIGIISFLRSQFVQLLKGNTNTRVILMSHDLQTIDDIYKVFDGINKSVSPNWKLDILMLEQNTLKPKNNIQNEYKSLIDIVYEYAKGNSNGHNLTIGNTIRRVAEAFTTFEYKSGIDKLYDTEVLSTIQDDTLREYFDGRLLKLLLNGGSHMQDRVRMLTNPGFTVQYSEKDKQQTARDIICLLYQLNKPHIEAYLNDKADLGSNITQWCNDIRSAMAHS